MSIVIDIAEGKKIVPHIVLVGAGGNGGLILQHIAQMDEYFSIGWRNCSCRSRHG
jgi:hypothetical protein